MKLGPRFGRLLFWRWQGNVFLDAARSWLVPLMAGAGVGKYLGLPSKWAVVGSLAIAVAVETLSTVVGMLAHGHGATESNYQTAFEKDPGRYLPVRRLDAVLAELKAQSALLDARLGRIEALLADERRQTEVLR